MSMLDKFTAMMRGFNQSGIRGLRRALSDKLDATFSIKPDAPETLIPDEYINLLLKFTSAAIGKPGDILEVGVYKGGSLYRIAEHIDRYHRQDFRSRSLIGIDTFEGHPSINRDKDPAHHFMGRFNDTSYKKVISYFKKFPFVRLIKGECGLVFSQFPPDQRFCMVHIDVDIYDSCVRCIEYIYPRLSPGGIMVFDEYQGYGQKEFINAYFKDKPVSITLRTGLPDGKDYGIIIYNNATTKTDAS